MTTFRLCVSACLVAGCAGDPPPELGVERAELLQLAVPSISPLQPTFEPVATHGGTSPSALLHFELELRNTGDVPMQIDQVTASYELGHEPFGVSPVVGLQDLRNHYLADCQRGGFGALRNGFLDLPLPELGSEELSDVHVREGDLFGTVRGTVATTNSAGQPVTVSRFAAVRVKDRETREWARLYPILFEDRANALVPADAGASAYVAVGGARTQGGTWRMAAVKFDLDGVPVWQSTVDIPGCEEEAFDVERLDQGSLPDQYLLGGVATCNGTKRAALVMLDSNGAQMWIKFWGPGPLPAQLNGVAIYEPTSQIYAVGSYGDHMLIINTDYSGNPDVQNFAGGGVRWIDPASHDAVIGREIKVLPDGRMVVAVEGRQVSTGNTQLGVWRFRTDGVLDSGAAGFNGTGARWVSFPGMIHAAGADLELHETSTWYTISGTARTATATYMAAAAFSDSGAIRTTFDGDGYLVATAKPMKGAFRTFLTGDIITLVGGTGSALGGMGFHRLEGTLDDRAILSPGKRCALRWPDSGIRPDGATHAINQWANGSIPQEVSAAIRFRPVPSGAPSTLTWGALLQMETIDTLKFPGHRLDAGQYWTVGQAHEIGTNHRSSGKWSTPLGRHVSSQRFAYDLGAARAVGDGWTRLREPEDPEEIVDGSQNDHYLVYGQDVFPMADGEIVSCGSGVQENAAPGESDVADMCNESGIPCYYDGGGNNVRIRHADGTFTWYAHMQNNLSQDLCEHQNKGGPLETPVAVTTSTVLGQVGNSGKSSAPHLHVQRLTPWPAGIDPFDVDSEDFNDGLPLLFNDVSGMPLTMAEDDFPAIATPMAALGHLSSTVLRHFAGGDPPPSYCLEIDAIGGVPPYAASQQPDGNAPPGNGRGFYCPDDGDTVNVCVETPEGSECRSCDTPQPGCPCAFDNECGLDMRCWGKDVQKVISLDRPGRCFPNSGVPTTHCAYDCRANLGANAWCYPQPIGGVARCYDGGTSRLEADVCWQNDDGPLAAYAGVCGTECTENAHCQNGGHGDPADPPPEHASGYPSEYVCNFFEAAGLCGLP